MLNASCEEAEKGFVIKTLSDFMCILVSSQIFYMKSFQKANF